MKAEINRDDRLEEWMKGETDGLLYQMKVETVRN